MTSSLGSLFPITTERGTEVIKPYHKSVADWVSDRSRAGAYFVDVNEGRRQLAESGWNEYEHATPSASAYFLKHLAWHLTEISNLERLLVLARDPRWLTLQEQTIGDDPHIAMTTIELALTAAAQGDDAVQTVELLLALAGRFS